MEFVFAAAAGLLLALRLRHRYPRLGVIVAALWTLLVPVPLVGAIAYGWWPGAPTPLDHAGALLTLMPLGLMLWLWSRWRADRSVQASHSTRLAIWLLASAFVLCLVAERAMSPELMTVGIAAISMSLAATLGALCVRIISGRSAGGAEWFTGALAGLAASATGGPWLTWQWHAVMGIAAGAIAALFARRLVRRAPDAADDARIASALTVGPMIGAIALGLFAESVGLVHTGAIDLTVEQARTVIIAFVWSLLITMGLTIMMKPRRQGRNAVGDAGLEPTTSSV